MSFDGSSGQRVQAPVPTQNLGGQGGLTICAWVKRESHERGYDRIIDFGNGEEKENIVINFGYDTFDMVYQCVRSGESQEVRVSAGSSAPDRCASNFPDDTWTHVAVVHEGDGTASIYWNGKEKARGSISLPNPVAREGYYVGSSHWKGDPHFKGEMSSVFVFNHALSPSELHKSMNHYQDSSRSSPVMSLAGSLQKATPPSVGRLASRAGAQPRCGCKWPLTPLLPMLRRELSLKDGSCVGGEQCGGGTHSSALGFIMCLSDDQEQDAKRQLQQALEAHHIQVANLEAFTQLASSKGRARDASMLAARRETARDALARARSIERMVNYRKRRPTEAYFDSRTDQLRQPPRLAAVIDTQRSVFYAFAITERRSASGSPQGPWHTYILEILSMRQLLPTQACWLPAVGALLITMIQRKAEHEHQVVVLKALNDAPSLECYYERIGFSIARETFAEHGLAQSYNSGEMIRA